LRKLGINRAFTSSGEAHPIRGANCSNFHEVAIKPAVIATAMENILVVDASKPGSLEPAFFAKLDTFSRIIVGGSAAGELRKPFEQLPVEYVSRST
jgi:DeoR family transcriptional regulator, deoxyribose operon repressor